MPDFKKPISVNGVQLTSATGIANVAAGGTGQSSYTIGDLLYSSGATALSKLAGVATGNALISGGVATAPSWGKIGLTTHVSGVLPLANGGLAVDGSAASPTLFGLNLGGASGATTGEIRAILSVNGSPTNVIQNSNAGSSAFSYLRMGNDTDNTSGILRNSSTNVAFTGANGLHLFQQGNYPIGFVTNNTLRMTISGAGAVSIPLSLTVTTGLNVGTATSAAAGEIRTVYSTSGPGSSYIRNSSTNSAAYGALYIGNNTDITSGILRASSNNTGLAGANSLNLLTTGAYAIGFATTNTLRMSISGAGAVNIVNSLTVQAGLNVGTASAAGTGEIRASSGVTATFLNIGNGTSGTSAIELGANATGNRFSYVDFTGDDTYTDYGLRVVRSNGGANTSSSLLHRGTGALQLTASDAGSLEFYTTNTLRIVVGAGGDVKIGTGTANTNTALMVYGANQLSTGYVISLKDSAGNNILYCNNERTSNVVQVGWTVSSDRSLKRNIQNAVPEQVHKAAAITLQQFQRTHADRLEYGYIAQDIQETHPELVTQLEDGKLGVDYNGAFALQIEQLKQEVRELRLLLAA